MNGDELDRVRRDCDVIPIVRTLSADALTPVVAFSALARAEEEAFLLESVERGESVGRYSFVGFAPRRRLAFSRDSSDAAGALRRELVPLRVWNEQNLPPFFGGAVGFFGYGVARWSERLPDAHSELEAIPDAVLLFFNRVLVFDHVSQKLMIVASLFADDPRDSETLLRHANAEIAEIIERLSAARIDLLELPSEAAGTAVDPFVSNCSREEFTSMVRRAKEEIAAGEVFQIVLSQRWKTDYPEGDALTLYRTLRTVNPSPYMFLLRTNECTLVGSSPELLVRERDGLAELRPIAGTRPRGATREQDLAFERELLADPKENAEHLMLVDLGRNDLGRVCTSGSVRVSEFRRIERYSHVMHIVSAVEGELRDDVTPIDLFLSAFPAGTVSGAPKIRAMELIDEIEPERRGPYAGAVAYVGFSGSIDSCISIRTIVLQGGSAYVQAGAGIVYDSDPEREFEETENKSAALRRAVMIAKEASRAR